MQRKDTSIFSYFDGPITTPSGNVPTREINLYETYSLITGETLKKQTELIRSKATKAERDQAKKQSPFITFSGTFQGTRKTENVTHHSGLIVIDQDNANDPESLKEKHKLAAMTLTSSGGYGNKSVYKIDLAVGDHLTWFTALKKYVEATTGHPVDPSGKDVTRACFLCHDPKAVYNPEAPRLSTDFLTEWSPAAKPEAQSDQFTGLLAVSLRMIKEAPDGEKHTILLKAARLAGGHVGAGRITYQAAERALFDAISKRDIDDPKGARQTITDGLTEGMTAPIIPAPATPKTAFNQFIDRIFSTLEIRRNIVNQVIEARPVGTVDPFAPINESDLYISLKSEGYKVSLQDITALMVSTLIPGYDPFLLFFESLPRPARDPLTTLQEYADNVLTTDQPDWVFQFSKWMVRAVRCSLEPDYMNKQCLILHSEKQNIGKSTWWRNLIPQQLRRYFSENFTPDKDGQISLCQNLILNLDELTGLKKVELNQLKAQFSRTSVAVRHPYGRKVETHPRRCSFVGSTNDTEFLTDTTGSVRWLIYTVVDIDFSYTSTPVEAVWSAAYQLYKSGFDCEMTPADLNRSHDRNETFTVTTAEADYVSRYFLPDLTGTGCHLSTTEIMDFINERHPSACLRSTDKLGKALQKAGFKRTAKKENGTTRRGYWLTYINQVATGCQVATVDTNFH